MDREFALIVNGETVSVRAPAATSLLDAPCHDLGLTATKYGCGIGQCGACTVIVDKAAEQACAITIADEMSATLVRTAFSSVVRDNHDYAVAIYDAGGRMLAQSNQCTPGQLGAMPLFVADCLKQYPAETLEPGDVIATGTPSGVGAYFTPPRFLKPGDKVRIEVEKIGVLQNTTVAEKKPVRRASAATRGR